MARDNAAVIALALGAGGGALLWYLLGGKKVATATASPPIAPASSAPSQDAPTTPSTPPSRTPGACQIRLDTIGLTTDGRPLTISGAVDLCKPAGKADLVYAHDAPATTLTDVYRALTTAGVSVVVWAP